MFGRSPFQGSPKIIIRLGQFFSLFLVGREWEKQCGRAENKTKMQKKTKLTIQVLQTIISSAHIRKPQPCPSAIVVYSQLVF